MTKEVKANTNKNIVRLFIIRHGQTDYNVKKILQGHIDIDLNEHGINQAKAVAKSLSDIKFDGFTSSDLMRCRDTTEEILKYQNEVKACYTSTLRERNMGQVQGMYIKDALEKYGDRFKELGEAKEELIDRVDSELQDIFKKCKTENYLNYGVCTHGGVITAITNYYYTEKNYQLENGLTPQMLRVPFNTSITILDLDKLTGQGKITIFGNTDHLGGHFTVADQLLR